jgi:hypothetical protein
MRRKDTNNFEFFECFEDFCEFLLKATIFGSFCLKFAVFEDFWKFLKITGSFCLKMAILENP